MMDQSAPAMHVQPPLRGETFSAEHLAAHAAEMAARHRVLERPRDDGRFVERFDANSRVVAGTCRLIAAAIKAGEAITPAAEWVIDNFHVIEEQLREIREDLPRGFYRELPKLAEGEWAGFPRVY